MKEAFLHYLWKHRLYTPLGLMTAEGWPIEVYHPGEHNTNAGPDFLNARIKIAETMWAGHVEIHVQSKDWQRHQHDGDPAYENVILHVVFSNNKVVLRSDGSNIPTLELAHKYDSQLESNYEQLYLSQSWIPCADFFSKLDPFIRDKWKESIMIERLESKCAVINTEFQKTKRNWEETFFRRLAANFGFKVNAAPFYELAASLGFKTLLKHRDDLHALEALLFGQAGMLEAHPEDHYVQRLSKEYKFYCKKYSLQKIQHKWKYMRMRPANFPTIRIAQFARLLHCSANVFSRAMEIHDQAALNHMFDIRLSGYWRDHYRFAKPSKPKDKRLGKTAIQLIGINTIVPFLFLFGKWQQNDRYSDKALELLEDLPFEQNSIISAWKEIGAKVQSALDSQALLHLKKHYCSKKKCLSCSLGHQLLKQ